MRYRQAAWLARIVIFVVLAVVSAGPSGNGMGSILFAGLAPWFSVMYGREEDSERRGDAAGSQPLQGVRSVPASDVPPSGPPSHVPSLAVSRKFRELHRYKSRVTETGKTLDRVDPPERSSRDQSSQLTSGYVLSTAQGSHPSMPETVDLPTLHCYRCVYSWHPVKSQVRICPRCKSKLWNIPKIRPVVLGTGLGIAELVLPYRRELLRLARRRGVERIWVFGSVRRHEADSKSDVDLMVRWKRPHSILDRVGLAEDMAQVLGRPVDLVNEGGLHWAIEPQIESERVAL